MLEDTNKRTELAELGEFGLIKLLTENIKIQNKSTIKGVGDDTAVLSYPKSEVLVTKDLLLEGVHFDMTFTPLKHLGYKAAVVNISDVVAMNGTPRQLVVGIGASNRFSVEALEDSLMKLEVGEDVEIRFVPGLEFVLHIVVPEITSQAQPYFVV